IVRSAVAFGADAVVTLKDRAAPVTPVVVRASAGATEHARIVRVTNLARSLAALSEQHGLQVVGLAADGEVDIDALPEADRGRVIVIGSEGKGMRPLVRKQCTVVARIPILGPVASLNASVAAGIALHAASRQRL
nr:RNA methyltransferase [Myxococcota bacterium]